MQSLQSRRAEISESLKAIDETLSLDEVYDGLPSEVAGRRYDLVALTAFYEQHYVCFCHVGGQVRSASSPSLPDLTCA